MDKLTFVVFMTARLVLSMPNSDLPLFEAGQVSCPVNAVNEVSK